MKHHYAAVISEKEEVKDRPNVNTNGDQEKLRQWFFCTSLCSLNYRPTEDSVSYHTSIDKKFCKSTVARLI